MALWSEERGLEAETRAHLTAVTRLDPGRDAAWIRLGCKKQGGRRVTDAQLATERDEAEAQRKADRYWKPLLVKWRGWLGEKRRCGPGISWPTSRRCALLCRGDSAPKRVEAMATRFPRRWRYNKHR
jgi:hypothetical protein